MSCFQNYKTDINGIGLPDKFTYPFYYEPHQLTLIASKELQDYLEKQDDFAHDFGLQSQNKDSGLGKMFGVLVVKKEDGNIGYLSAFSGKLEDGSLPQNFVPPIYNVHEKDTFFKKGEVELDLLTEQIKTLINDQTYKELLNRIELKADFVNQELQRQKALLKTTKKDRQLRREQAQKTLSKKDFDDFNNSLAKESIEGQLKLKKQKIIFKEELGIIQQQLNEHNQKIVELKHLRKNKSSKLQKQVFDQYQFLNINKEKKGLTKIFPNYQNQKPPSGSGDCSAPKLLQYAFQNNMKPIALAEFWWGISPKNEIRKHKQYYPACRGRCKPILKHMLEGIIIEDNPLEINPELKELEIIYEDAQIIIINKPADYLTVPGKESTPSIYSEVRKIYPQIEDPIIVHRLDMATSGVLVLSKTKEAHKNLQSQFLKRTIKKRYTAILDGSIDSNEGMIELPLRVDLDDRPRQLVCYDHGKAARTKWKVVDRKNNQTRVHLYPITGRTHQLRVHMAHTKGLNTPIVGDDLYGIKGERLLLHADYIQFIHPSTGKKMNFKAKAAF